MPDHQPDPRQADPVQADPDHQPGPEAIDVAAELQRKSPARRALEGLVSVLALVIMFALVLPKVTGSTYRDVLHELETLSVAEIAALSVVWALGIVVYAGVLTAVLPGLRRAQGVVLNTATSAVSNVVPFGGAVGVGATYGINRSWGFTAPAITLAILVSGVWNVFLKLGLPVVALVLLVLAGEASGGLAAAAALGAVALAGSVVVLTLVMRSERLASTIGRAAQRAVSWGLGTIRRPDRLGVEQAVLDFRHRSSGLISHRWPRITVWMLGYSLMQFLLQLLCLRFLGEDTLTPVEVFAGFAFGRLLSTIPITPSGVGFADTGAVASLVYFGGDRDICTAGVLLFTGFIFLLEIPVGGVSWIVWGRMKRWRRPPGSVPQPVFSSPAP